MIFYNMFLRNIIKNIVFLIFVRAYIDDLHNINDLDIYLEVIRGATGNQGCWLEVPKNAPYWQLYFYYNLYKNCMRDGRNEGLSKGYLGDYDYNDTSISLVPYGCWYRTHKTGMYINLGNKIIIEDRRYLKEFWKLDNSDRLFCSKALNDRYTSVVTNNPNAEYLTFGSELITCYGSCGTVKFNSTCPPGIEIFKGYQASKSCTCSDLMPTLNCDKQINNIENVVFNTTINENKCILETIDLATHEINSIRNISLTLFFTFNLFAHSNKIMNPEKHKIIWKKINSLNSETMYNDNNTNILLLNLQRDFAQITHNKIFSIPFYDKNVDDNDEKMIEWEKSYDVRSILNPFNITTGNNNIDKAIIGYSASPLYQLSTRKIITINGVYIGIITSMQEFHYNKFKSNHQLLKWLSDDVRCLVKLGAYTIILMGNFDYKLSVYLMHYLHKYVDVIIAVGGNIEPQKNSIYSSQFDDNIDNRILQLKEPEDDQKNSGSLSIKQLSISKRTLNPYEYSNNIAIRSHRLNVDIRI